MSEVGLPLSPVEFSSLLSQVFLLLVAGHAPRSCRSLSSLPGLFIYSSGKDSLPPIFSTQCVPPSFLHVFIVLIAYYSVSLFSPDGGRSVQGVMLIWPRLVCGSTREFEHFFMYLLSIYTSSFENSVFNSYALFFIGVLIHWGLRFLSSL
jgi:hypothetical protein